MKQPYTYHGQMLFRHDQTKKHALLLLTETKVKHLEKFWKVTVFSDAAPYDVAGHPSYRYPQTVDSVPYLAAQPGSSIDCF